MFRAGAARTCLTPFWGVELTGWGYYIERRWQRVRDDLNATAIVVDDGQRQAVLLALDLMVIDEPFARAVRAHVHEATGLPEHAIMVSCSHTHNAPASGGLLGVGECDSLYEEWASRQAATAVVLAWQRLQPATVRSSHADVPGLTFNRTRAGGLTDNRLTALRIDRPEGDPIATVVNFGAHPTVTTELWPWDVTRDIPGLICDLIEAAFPGSIAMYLQGACGDVNFLREFTALDRYTEPATILANAAIDCLSRAKPIEHVFVASAASRVNLETRRWLREEIEADRHEAERRIRTDDTSNWRETIGRSMTNRPDDMVKRHGGDELKAVRAMCRFHIAWTEKMLRDFETRPTVLNTEVQAIRIGETYCVANASEFFTPFYLNVRERAAVPELMIACYTNGRIGYLPDEHDIAAKTYAGLQSPKYCNQFPFTPRSGFQMCDALLSVIETCRSVSE